jgi:hypothetical protein
MALSPGTRLGHYVFDDRFIRAQSANSHTSYDVAPDRQFLMLENVDGLNRIEVVAGWFTELESRVPVP